MIDFFSGRFSSLMGRLTGGYKLTENNLQDVLTQIIDTLIEADVPHKIAVEFVTTIKKEVVGKKIFKSLKPAEQFTKIIYDRMATFLGGATQGEFKFKMPSVILVMGLQGAGKTTTIGKLVHYIKKLGQKQNKHRKILVGSVDFYRPAAVDQLQIVAQQSGADFYRATAVSPIEAAAQIYTHYKSHRYELLILDTAGRLHVDSNLLQELREIEMTLCPEYKLLVVDSMTGQESITVAQAFNQSVGFDGVILTKTDSDARCGALFTFRYVLDKPIVFIAHGERKEDLSSFYPDRAASKILGMGDLKTLLEHAEEKIQVSEQKALHTAMATGKFTLVDFATQLEMVNRMGSLAGLIKYMPGLEGKSISDADITRGEQEIRRFRALINSMTLKERDNPAIIERSRAMRIERGAGVPAGSLGTLLDRFKQAQQYVTLLTKQSSFKSFFK